MPLTQEYRNSAAARTLSIEHNGISWRVVDMRVPPRGPRIAVAPGSDPHARARFFISDEAPEVRRWNFVDGESRDVARSVLLDQLARSIPAESPE